MNGANSYNCDESLFGGSYEMDANICLGTKTMKYKLDRLPYRKVMTDDLFLKVIS